MVFLIEEARSGTYVLRYPASKQENISKAHICVCKRLQSEIHDWGLGFNRF